MSFVGSAFRAVRLGFEARDAGAAFLAEYDAGHGPLAGLVAFAKATDGQLDDAAVAELLEVARAAVEYGETGLGWCASAIEGLEQARHILVQAATVTQYVAARLADPKLPARIDQATAAVLEVGWRLVGARATLRVWLDAATSS